MNSSLCFQTVAATRLTLPRCGHEPRVGKFYIQLAVYSQTAVLMTFPLKVLDYPLPIAFIYK